MRFRPFLLAALLSWSSLGLAADVFFTPDEPEHNLGYLVKVAKLEEGDHVFFLSKDQRMIQFDYVLGEYLGEGMQGRVFKIKHADGTFTALKIGKRRHSQNQIFISEIEAHDRLVKSGIDTSETLASDSHVFVEKQFVEGPTLLNVAQNWSAYPVDVQKKMSQELANLSAKLIKSPWAYDDLRASNISWDIQKQRWSVLDPGLSVSKSNYEHVASVKPIYEVQLKKSYSDMNRAYSVARQNPEWLDSTLELEKAVAQLEKDRTPETIARFQETAQKGARQAPGEYRELVSKGEALAKGKVPQEDRKKSFLVCVFSRIMKTK
jgi:hypothetical protein